MMRDAGTACQIPPVPGSPDLWYPNTTVVIIAVMSTESHSCATGPDTPETWPEPSSLPRRKRRQPHPNGILLVILGAVFMALLDATVVNVATPTMRTDLRATGSALQLIVMRLYDFLCHAADNRCPTRRPARVPHRFPGRPRHVHPGLVRLWAGAGGRGADRCPGGAGHRRGADGSADLQPDPADVRRAGQGAGVEPVRDGDRGRRGGRPGRRMGCWSAPTCSAPAGARSS